MSVYFATRADNPNGPVKIGYTTRLDERLKHLARSYYSGLLLIGIFESGTKAVERSFHEAMKEFRVEGEWFHQGEALHNLIKPFRLEHPRFYSCHYATYKTSSFDTPKAADKEIARELLKRFMQMQRERESLQYCLEEAFLRLNKLNPFWTRRKVRSLWNKESNRVEYFQIRNIETILSGMDRPGNKGE